MTHEPDPTLVTRREFIRATTTVAAAGAITTAPFVSHGQVRGANDRLGIGFIGVGGRGMSHVSLVKRLKQEGEPVEIVAVSDTWAHRRNEAALATRMCCWGRRSSSPGMVSAGWNSRN